MTKRIPTLLAATCCLCTARPGLALDFELQAASTTFGEFSAESVRATHGEATNLTVSGIRHARLGPLGDLEVRCPTSSPVRCGDGLLTWKSGGTKPLAFEFERRLDQFTLSGDGGSIDYRWSGQGRAGLAIRDIPARWIPSTVLVEAGLADLSGSFSGRVDLSDGQVQAALRIGSLSFDTPDGRFAGGGLALSLNMDWTVTGGPLKFDAEWLAGELLLGPVYLPSPEAPVALELSVGDLNGDDWAFERVELRQAQSIALTASGRIVPDDPLPIAALDLEIEHADIARLWRQGLNSLAGTVGWAKLEPSGRLAGRVRLENDAIASARLRLADASVEDGAERISVQGLTASLDWDGASESLAFNADWRDAGLLRIPLGGSTLALRTDGAGTLALSDTFSLPVLDGALSVERLEWRDWIGPDRQLALDARLEPINLSALTRTLGWTEFGGRLSGRFPGIRFSEGVIDVQGGLDLDLFGGGARINRLSVERPFGSLPALAADIEFQALDLEQVTGTFEFGRMSGLLSGHVRNLRLLDWQPVQFDAWFETLDDSPNRKISQKAVGSISSLSGGGSAALSGTLLRWFDDFPYRKAGLGCRLAENVCHMRGLRDTEHGGYLILDGRLIPKLSIVGYQRRVDWPRLIAQLAAATGSIDL